MSDAPHPALPRRRLPALAVTVGLAVLLAAAVLAALLMARASTTQREAPAAAQADDALAKSHVRSMSTAVEACFADTQDYSRCVPDAGGNLNGQATRIPGGSAPGQVAVDATQTGYTIAARSKSGAVFRLVMSGSLRRSCAPVGGGCPSGGNW